MNMNFDEYHYFYYHVYYDYYCYPRGTEVIEQKCVAYLIGISAMSGQVVFDLKVRLTYGHLQQSFVLLPKERLQSDASAWSQFRIATSISLYSQSLPSPRTCWAISLRGLNN